MPIIASFSGIGLFPVITSVTSLAENKIRLSFSSSMGMAVQPLLTGSNFTINNSAGSAARFVSGSTSPQNLTAPNYVDLTFDGEMTNGGSNYQLTASAAVTDLAGNSLTTNNIGFNGFGVTPFLTNINPGPNTFVHNFSIPLTFTLNDAFAGVASGTINVFVTQGTSSTTQAIASGSFVNGYVGSLVSGGVNGFIITINPSGTWGSGSNSVQVQAQDKVFNQLSTNWTFNDTACDDVTILMSSANKVPRAETLVLHWNFETVTGSSNSSDGQPTTSDAKFIVQDVTSGSTDLINQYGWLGPIRGHLYPGRGDFFLPFQTNIIDKQYVYSAKQQHPEIINSANLVEVLEDEELIFTRDTRPIKYFYAIERSLYSIVTEEILKLFSTFVDFNDLIGEPANRYRQEYKALEKLRHLFFSRMGNNPDVEKYVDYFKWIDSSISQMLTQLIPASANFSSEIRTVIESHILERNKYWTKYPTIEFMHNPPEAPARGINELLYSWQSGSAPPSRLQTDHILWWQQRAERTNPAIVTPNNGANFSRTMILSASISALNRNFGNPVRTQATMMNTPSSSARTPWNASGSAHVINLTNKKDGTLPSIPVNPAPAGNYHTAYQIVQTSGRSLNNRYLIKSGGAGIVVNPSRFSGSAVYSLPDRSSVTSKHVFVELFSAPGGPEVLSRGSLDPIAEELAVHNDLNFRNQIVRGQLSVFEQTHTAQFGLNPNSPLSGNYHKVNRNTARRMQMSGNVVITGSRFDNEYVQHPIPQSDIQYQWISASIDTTMSQPLGYVSNFNVPVGKTGSVDPIQLNLISGSQIISPKGISLNFIGMNTLIYDPIDITQNILSASDGNYLNTALDTLGMGNTLNSLLLHRNGPYQFASWKQLRVGETPVARKLKNSNIISMIDPPVEFKITTSDGHTIAIKNEDADTFTNYSEPAVGFKNKPMVHYFDVEGSAQPLGLKHTYANNLVAFANPNLNNRLGIFKCDNQMYDRLKDFYINSDMGPGENPVKGFLKLTYAEGIYPKEINTGLRKIRGRLNYSENAPVSGTAVYGFYALSASQPLTTEQIAVADYSDSGIDRNPRLRRTFWRRSAQDRNRWGLITDNLAHNPGTGDRSGFGLVTTPLVNSQGIMDGNEMSVFPFGVALQHTQSQEDASGSFFMGTYPNYDFGELAPSRGTYGIGWANFNGQGGNTEFGIDVPWAKFQNIDPTNYFFNYPSASALYTKQVNPDHLIFANYYAGGDGTISTGVPIPVFQDDFDHRFRVNVFAGKDPWFDSYDEYSQDIRYMGKDYSIIPEFNVSKNMDYYVLGQGGNFRKQNDRFLSNFGASITQSAQTETGGFDENFFAIYSHSDFMKYFDVINNDHDNPDLGVSKITLKCKGIKKLLPYNGFYPVNRTLQLATLFSQSYAPFIGGVGWLRGGPLTASALPPSGNLAIAALLQPFFAPGILYNTIKSGIAMDFPVFTGSQGIAAGGAGVSSVRYTVPTNYRLSFESLLDLKNGGALGGVPVSGTSGDKKIHWLGAEYLPNAASGSIFRDVYFDWTGEESSPLYRLAMHNFLAESINFFINDGKLKTITSKPANKIKSMVSGNVYYMDVRMSRNQDFLMYGGRWNQFNKLFHTATVAYNGNIPYATGKGGNQLVPDYAALSYTGKFFGHPFRWTEESTDIFATGVQTMGNVTSHARLIIYDDAAYAPYLPPYWFGDSIARISYKANGQEKNQTDIISSIFAGMNVENINNNLLNKMAFYNTGSTSYTTDRPAFTERSTISSSVNLFGVAKGQQIRFDPNSLDPVTGKAKAIQADDTDANANSWVIYPKFECPILNFIHQPEELYTIIFENGAGKLNTTPGPTYTTPPISGASYPIPKGMWSGYGEFCTGSTGVFLSIEESFPSLSPTQRAVTGSLVDVFGFNTSPQRLGEVAPSKEISEAIVAIPFVDHPSIQEGFAPTITVMGRNFFAIDKGLFDKQNNRKAIGQHAIQPGDFGNIDIADTSISDLTMTMKKYVIPPEMNFLKFDDIPPFVMYMFEFTHKLDQQDIADIWQGVMPKIAMNAEKDEVEVSHSMKPWEFFEGKKLPQKIRWMVFKVKRQAAVDYFDKTADSRDDSRFKFDFKVGTKAPEYSFNWPYDFCSLVELAKIDAEIDISPKPKDVATPHLDTIQLLNRPTIDDLKLLPQEKLDIFGKKV